MNDNTHRKANPLAVSRRGALHAGLLGIGGKRPEPSVGKNAGKYCNRTGVHI